MDTENISDARKTAVINNELLRLKVDNAAWKHALQVKAQLREMIIHSFVMVSLLTNVGNIV